MQRFIKCELFGLIIDWMNNGMNENAITELLRFAEFCKELPSIGRRMIRLRVIRLRIITCSSAADRKLKHAKSSASPPPCRRLFCFIPAAFFPFQRLKNRFRSRIPVPLYPLSRFSPFHPFPPPHSARFVQSAFSAQKTFTFRRSSAFPSTALRLTVYFFRAPG